MHIFSFLFFFSCISFHRVSLHPSRWVVFGHTVSTSPDTGKVWDSESKWLAQSSPPWPTQTTGSVEIPWLFAQGTMEMPENHSGTEMSGHAASQKARVKSPPPRWQWGLPELGLRSGRGPPTVRCHGMLLHEGLASSESLLGNVQLNSLSRNSSPWFFYKENDMVARPWATA